MLFFFKIDQIDGSLLLERMNDCQVSLVICDTIPFPKASRERSCLLPTAVSSIICSRFSLTYMFWSANLFHRSLFGRDTRKLVFLLLVLLYPLYGHPLF